MEYKLRIITSIQPEDTRAEDKMAIALKAIGQMISEGYTCGINQPTNVVYWKMKNVG